MILLTITNPHNHRTTDYTRADLVREARSVVKQDGGRLESWRLHMVDGGRAVLAVRYLTADGTLRTSSHCL